MCSNDVALVWLGTAGGQQAYQAAGGFYNYLANPFEATSPPQPVQGVSSIPKYLAVTQLGYPAAWDSGARMQMSNSPGYAMNIYVGSGKTLKNIIRGTSMTGGSSGGPWLLNLGQDAVASGVNYGKVTIRNAVIATTSWGYSDNTIKTQGASVFTQNNEFPGSAYGNRGAGNIGALVWWACDASGGWRLQAKGFCRYI